jgi:CubicO group peptidase (beta-lactamase class C family)
MHKVFKWGARIGLVGVLAAASVGLWKREEITRLLAVNSLFNANKIVHNFSNMNAAFLNVELGDASGPVTELPTGPSVTMPEDYEDWVKSRSVTSTLVLKDGQIAHEAYYLGTTAQDRRISWSVAKSYLSALFGILVDEGAIASLDDPVVKYAPTLANGAYASASVLNVLQMSSGVTFDEDYLDKNSDINRMGRVLALGGKMDDFAAGLTDSFTPAGQEWKYTSIDTHVVGMIARGATGRNIPDLLNDKILSKLGQEQPAYYLTDGVGVAFVLGGLNVTTRDYARFGQMIMQDGKWNGEQIVPADWIAESTQPSAKTKEGKIGYGYQWWVPIGAVAGEEFTGRGIYGQYIYINKPAGVVIVSTAADKLFREAGVGAQNIDMFRQIVAASGEE